MRESSPTLHPIDRPEFLEPFAIDATEILAQDQRTKLIPELTGEEKEKLEEKWQLAYSIATELNNDDKQFFAAGEVFDELERLNGLAPHKVRAEVRSFFDEGLVESSKEDTIFKLRMTPQGLEALAAEVQAVHPSPSFD